MNGKIPPLRQYLEFKNLTNFITFQVWFITSSSKIIIRRKCFLAFERVTLTVNNLEKL